MDKRRILYLHSSDELYGADRSLFRLVRDLDDESFSPLVVISNDVHYEKHLLSAEFEKIKVKHLAIPLAVLRRKYFRPTGLAHFFFLATTSFFRLSSLVFKQRVDIIHSNSSAVISGSVVSFVTRRPHVWHVREIYTTPPFLGKAMAWILSNFSYKIIAVSGPVRDQLIADGCDPDKIVVIHNGIDLDCFGPNPLARKRIRNELGIPLDAQVVGMLGRISNWKGQDILVQAAQLVVEKHPQTVFLLVGGVVPWELSRRHNLLQLLDQLQLTRHVILEDFRTDVPDLLASFDVFVLPSTRPDPYPTVVLEAMATGLPIIATAWGGAVEMVDKTSGILVPPKDPKALALAICRLLQDSQTRSNMGRAARARAQAEFATSACVAAIERQYS